MQWYRQVMVQALNQEINWSSDDLRMTLHTSAYTLDADTDVYVDDLTDELPTADGYTQGGMQLTSVTIAYTAADSWADTWAGTTEYTSDYIVRPTTGNGFLYRALSPGGTSGGAEPTWPTVIGETVADGSVVWECAGRGIIVLDSDQVEWDPATFTGVRHIVLSDRTPVGDAAQPLIGYRTLGSDTDADGLFRFVPHAQGWLQFLVP